MGEVRIGKVSSIDYEHGMISVLYDDLEGCVTDHMPCLEMNGEYKMPPIGSMVLVLHLSNGLSMGIVCGGFWNEANVPQEYGKGLYRKEMGAKPGEAYLKFHEGKLLIKAPQIILETGQGRLSVDELRKNGGE